MPIRLKAFVSELTKPIQTLSNTRILHGLTIKNPLIFNDPSFHTTKIIRLYAINNDLISARNLFDETPQRTIYLWNSIIRAYAKTQQLSEAFLLFNRLLISETQPDNYTFACILRACSDKSDIEALRLVHGKMVVFGLGLDLICNSALVSCYSKLRLLDDAYNIFRGIEEPDLVLWNALISGYGSFGDSAKGLELLKAMRFMGIQPDGFTMVGLIAGVSDHGLLKTGDTIHGLCVKFGLILNDHVASALISMYSRCRNMDMASSVFNCLDEPDLVSWSALIAGFSQAGDFVKALIFFRKLVMDGGRPDPVLLASVVAASAQLTIVGPGREIHGYAIRHDCEKNTMISSALIDMYCKCGFLDTSIKVFKRMQTRNIVSYNSIISGLALSGKASESFRLLDQILEVGLRPDETTFAGILCACCHAGLVDDGKLYFSKMVTDFGIEAKTEHYIYMVKLLGMDGQVEEAFRLIKSLPEPIDSGIWGTLLSCCDSHKNYELLEVIAEHLSENKSRSIKYSVMISNVFAGDGRWDHVEKLRSGDGGARGKMPGISWISGVNC